MLRGARLIVDAGVDAVTILAKITPYGAISRHFIVIVKLHWSRRPSGNLGYLVLQVESPIRKREYQRGSHLT